jgi:phenylalanyl-tRNA synthetase beta chain
MNIQILDSWLKDYLKTDATPKQIAEKLSLTSVSIERIEKYKDDFLYDIEVTTNRPDLASVVGLAREAAAVLPQFGIEASFLPQSLEKPETQNLASITIENDPNLVNRICAVVMEVSVKDSPQAMKDRLESSSIRSLNNLIDITNYVMRTIGHPTHVFDFDRLQSQKLIIRESQKGEEIVTLDEKKHTLNGGDIVAVDENGRIIDLLGVMGLENSVVTENTKRILFFIDNNEPNRMRKTSMSLAIRTEAVQLNEKSIDPELAFDALLYGIKLYQELADGKVISEIIDIYPNKPKVKTITVSGEKINAVIGASIPLTKAASMLEGLGFQTKADGDVFTVTVPSWRVADVAIEEDIIEEVARLYGYHNIQSLLPPMTDITPKTLGSDIFFWEKRVKEAMKYWGYTEVYTYAMVSESMYEGPLEQAVTIQNPLTEDGTYMRNTLIQSLLQVIHENRNREVIQVFEIANVYTKNGDELPTETRMFAGVLKKPKASFYDVKGLLEQVFTDLGIKHVTFVTLEKGGMGADIQIQNVKIGEVEVLEEGFINFELNFESLLTHATLKKTYTPLSKYPPLVEDLAFIVPDTVKTGDIISVIAKQSPLITTVSLLDKFQDSRTFHIVYQSNEKNLSSDDIKSIREKIIKSLTDTFSVTLK